MKYLKLFNLNEDVFDLSTIRWEREQLDYNDIVENDDFYFGGKEYGLYEITAWLNDKKIGYIEYDITTLSSDFHNNSLIKYVPKSKIKKILEYDEEEPDDEYVENAKWWCDAMLLHVEPEYRGSGVAKELMERMFSHVKELGINYVIILSKPYEELEIGSKGKKFSDKEIDALALWYERFGFEKVQRYKGIRSGWIMYKYIED